MKIVLFTLCLCLFALAGCATFEENLQESEKAGSTQSLNEKEEKKIEELSAGGQLNQDEEEAMNQEISSSGDSGF